MANLSKSQYLMGCQCTKALYLKCNSPELADEITNAQQAVFDTGNTVGELARNLFPGGVDATRGEYFNFNAALNYTQELINNGTEVIYEAGFKFEETFCYIDILVKKSNTWCAYEVKSSTEVKEYHLLDSSFQYYVITNSGLALEEIAILHLNNQYIRNGDIDLKELFIAHSVKEEVTSKHNEVLANIRSFSNLLDSDVIPEIAIGSKCNKPYACSFHGHCWKHIPEYSIFDIANLKFNKKDELYNKGILTFDQIPNDFPLSNKQRLQVNSELNTTTIINRNNINSFLQKITYPVYFMDFESFQSSIPLFDYSKPYQQICFQYSLHKLESLGGQTSHYEFLSTPPINPRIEFIERLIKDCGANGTILVYNKGFEKGRLYEIKKHFTQYTNQIDAIIMRIVDLMTPFQNMDYYTPEMKGSYSIKHVLPALIPHLSYDGLEINNGGLASNSYFQMQSMNDSEQISQIRSNLLEYCKMDTWAMVKLLEKLYEVQ